MRWTCIEYLQSIIQPVGLITIGRKQKTGERTEPSLVVGIPEDAMDLYNQYAGKLQNRYASHISLDRALSIGMRAIGKELKISYLEFYVAKHAFWGSGQK